MDDHASPRARRGDRAAGAVLAERLRSHRLTAPARTVVDAAEHLLATQAQEFWGGRWALAARTRGRLSLRDVDAAFDRGELVRTWTMRGTLHIVPPHDAAWMLSLTTARQQKQWAVVHRGVGLAEDDLVTAERAVRAALGGGNRLTRAEFGAVLAGAGVDPVGMRGNLVLSALAIRGVVVLGPVVPRDGAPTRDQYVVAADGGAVHTPDDPLAEFFVRYITGHGPAGARDFAWWSGLPLGVARDAEERAAGSGRLTRVGDALWVAAERPRRQSVPRVVALPPFEEYYLSYADRSLPCIPEFAAAVGPTQNGIVHPVIVADGLIVGTWAHSHAVGRHAQHPTAEVFAPDAAPADEVAAALARYRDFVVA
ncbi:winged helix DNA-binding domain-containing protein [Microbacterium fluvii]|uniref:Winged helix DNA-binding domain-containing protein n=1 Tax=Microbacterium fluvii TaxID=415215 RepID=A0ABW2HE37_9MICO|nr:winged helix DNA-binding domain-containing protein [Microbacterium fluvii]MCU4671350.1 winged helix DNA-binding domain-containing protein [Microbacterium fluvii]